MSTAPAERGYLLCGSPRSGSTMLCDLLRRSGCAGAPESLFRPADIGWYANDWGVGAPDGGWDRAYVQAALRHGTAATGCFGVRIMWSDMPGFLTRLAQLYPAAGEDRDRLRGVFGIDRYVRLTRQDLVAQAVSLVIANQTGLWHRNADGSERERTKPGSEPRYDGAAIAAAWRMLQAESDEWRSWFGSCGITPLAVTYEELAADPTQQLTRVLAHLDVASTIALRPGTARLADELNLEWSARFRTEALADRSA